MLTYSVEVKETYKEFLLATRELKNLLVNKQKSFYEERIYNLENELEEFKKK